MWTVPMAFRQCETQSLECKGAWHEKKHRDEGNVAEGCVGDERGEGEKVVAGGHIPHVYCSGDRNGWTV